MAYAFTSAVEVIGEEPFTYKEAMASKDSNKRLTTMRSEIESLKKNHTWELVERPKRQQVVGCKWLYKIKEGARENSKPMYKTRLVARGFTQVPGIDFNEVFSSVVRHISIRILLAITAQLDLNLEQMDVTTAFLHRDQEERILMDHPKGFEAKGEVEKVCLLRKSLYGLKQSPRQWY